MLKTAFALMGAPLAIGASRMACGAHMTRYQMYESLKGLLPAALGKRTLNISHSDILITHLGIDKSEIVEAAYPEYSATDLSAFADNSFDYVISDQVLEHVEGNPQNVFDESRRVLKPGGIAVHTTCFIQPIHGYPSDFWRFTPACLKMLAKDYSKILACDGFGNRFIWYADILGLRGVPVPHAKWHPLNWIATKNMKAWPVSVWVAAQK